VLSTAYSPDGQHIISGSSDRTVRIWDARTGAAVRRPLKRHTGHVLSVAYSPDRPHIVSGSSDRTSQIWDARTGAVGRLLEGHTGCVQSVSYSPDGQHIVSGSDDKTIQIWDSRTGAVVGRPLEGHTGDVFSVAFSPDGRHLVSGSGDGTIHVWDSFLHAYDHSHSSNSMCATFHVQPDPDGWVKDPQGGLLYWVPPHCRTGLHSPSLLTIPLTSHIPSVSLDFEDFAFGTSWSQIFNSP
jgi:WD40 repeat protein